MSTGTTTLIEDVIDSLPQTSSKLSVASRSISRNVAVGTSQNANRPTRDEDDFRERNMRKLADALFGLFRRASRQTFEDGVATDFSRELTSLIIAHGEPALSILAGMLNQGGVRDEVMGEALRWVGDVVVYDLDVYVAKRSLLEKGLFAASATVRDGAVIGLSYLGDPHAVPFLRKALAAESSPFLRQDMQFLINELTGAD